MKTGFENAMSDVNYTSVDVEIDSESGTSGVQRIRGNRMLQVRGPSVSYMNSAFHALFVLSCIVFRGGDEVSDLNCSRR